MSSKDGLVPLARASFGLGMACADGMGDLSLKMSGVGQEGCHRGVEYREPRVWWNTLRNSSGFGKCSLT